MTSADIGAAKVVETHTARLFFVGDLVLKVKKPVDLGFLDFTSRAARTAACEQEVALNRRLAPDVYLGVAELRRPDGGTWEHMVVMRRLPDDRRLSAILNDENPPTDQFHRLGRLIAAFHQRCPGGPEITALGSQEAVARLWSDNTVQLRGYADSPVPAEQIEMAQYLAQRYIEHRGALFRQRQKAGFIRDGHGDLSAEDIFCLPDGPRVLDCLEFDSRLRAGDVLLDCAALEADLERLGAPGAAQTFRQSYREYSAESHPESLAEHYLAYRCQVATKVGCIKAAQGAPHAAQDALRMLRLCLDHLGRARVRLVLLGGLPGTGKTTLGLGLAELTGWPLISSDVVRKELAGMPPDQAARRGFEAGIYSAAHTERTYAEMLHRADRAHAFGTSVILDATWEHEELRRMARAKAAAGGADLIELELTCSEEVARSRLAGRRGAEHGSGADEAVRDRLAAAASPWPEATQIPTEGSFSDVLAGIYDAVSQPAETEVGLALH